MSGKVLNKMSRVTGEVLRREGRKMTKSTGFKGNKLGRVNSRDCRRR